jgi:hypothetical protein
MSGVLEEDWAATLWDGSGARPTDVGSSPNRTVGRTAIVWLRVLQGVDLVPGRIYYLRHDGHFASDRPRIDHNTANPFSNIDS